MSNERVIEVLERIVQESRERDAIISANQEKLMDAVGILSDAFTEHRTHSLSQHDRIGQRVKDLENGAIEFKRAITAIAGPHGVVPAE